MLEEPEEGLESDFDGAEPEPVDGFAASVFLSSAFTALSVAASFFSSTFSLSAAGAFEALSVTLFTTSLPASPVRVPSPLETASFTLSSTLSISSWVTSPAGLVSPMNSVLPESFEAPETACSPPPAGVVMEPSGLMMGIAVISQVPSVSRTLSLPSMASDADVAW